MADSTDVVLTLRENGEHSLEGITLDDSEGGDEVPTHEALGHMFMWLLLPENTRLRVALLAQFYREVEATVAKSQG